MQIHEQLKEPYPEGSGDPMYNGLEPDPHSDPLRLSEIPNPLRRGGLQAEEINQIKERIEPKSGPKGILTSEGIVPLSEWKYRKEQKNALPLFWFLPAFAEYQHKARRYTAPILVVFSILRLRAKGVRAGWYKSESDPNYIRAFEFSENGNMFEVAVRFPRWMIEAECSFWNKRFHWIAKYISPPKK